MSIHEEILRIREEFMAKMPKFPAVTYDMETPIGMARRNMVSCSMMYKGTICEYWEWRVKYPNNSVEMKSFEVVANSNQKIFAIRCQSSLEQIREDAKELKDLAFAFEEEK